MTKKPNFINKQRGSIFLVLLFYSAGLIGILLPESRSWFLAATPLTLCISTFLMLWNHQNWNIAFVLFCFLAFVTGLGVEILGVATGHIFGTYHYGEVLGWQMMEVPLVIGVNWLLCLYCSGVVAQFLLEKLGIRYKNVAYRRGEEQKLMNNKVRNLGAVFLGATLMVLLDLVLEPVAIQFEFWYWANDVVPIQNYIAWFVISFLLMGFFFALPFSKKNAVALILYPLLIVFFALLSLSSRYLGMVSAYLPHT